MMTQVVSLLLRRWCWWCSGVGDNSAFGETHLIRNNNILPPMTLDQLNATLTLNGKKNISGMYIEENLTYTVAVESNAVPMKGCLLTFLAVTDILQEIAIKDIMIVIPLTNTKNADVCDSSDIDKVGVTHFDATEKSICSCTFELTSPVEQLVMFVTIVIANNLTNSIYAEQQYTVFTKNLPGPTTRAPRSTPTTLIPTVPAPARSPRAPVSTPTAPTPNAPTPTSAAGFVMMSITTTLLIFLALTAAVVVL
jgi:hypothetical protein